MDLVYHENQVGRMCAQHALNMLLQGHYFTAENLVTIAQELDQRERAVLEDESQFQSQNYDDSGYFSIQVITEALRRQANLHLEPLESPTVFKILQNPSMAQAFICHFEDHWFTVRKIGSTWFILNSLFKAPRVISESFLELYVSQLHAEGWTIYVVEGQLPSCAADSVPREYWNEARRTRKYENDLEKAIALSLNEAAKPYLTSNNPDEELTATSASMSMINQAEELEIQKALEESLREANRLNSLHSTESSLVQEAVKRSLTEVPGTSKQNHGEEQVEEEEDLQNQQSSSGTCKKE